MYKGDIRDLRFKFGIEIECFGCTRQIIKDELTKLGINAEIQTYNHIDLEGIWKITYDGSVTNEGTEPILDLYGNTVIKGIEVVSPPLTGEDGLEELRKVCMVLNKVGAKVDSTCGLHVHIDSEFLDYTDIKNILVFYYNNQYVIDNLFSEERYARNCKFCKEIELEQLEKVRYAKSKEQIGFFMKTRHKVVNARSYRRHVNTIEFRQHPGTINFIEIRNWLFLLQYIVGYSKDLNGVLKINRDENIIDQFYKMNKDLKLYKTPVFAYIMGKILKEDDYD